MLVRREEPFAGCCREETVAVSCAPAGAAHRAARRDSLLQHRAAQPAAQRLLELKRSARVEVAQRALRRQHLSGCVARSHRRVQRASRASTWRSNPAPAPPPPPSAHDDRRAAAVLAVGSASMRFSKVLRRRAPCTAEPRSAGARSDEVWVYRRRRRRRRRCCRRRRSSNQALPSAAQATTAELADAMRPHRRVRVVARTTRSTAGGP